MAELSSSFFYTPARIWKTYRRFHKASRNPHIASAYTFPEVMIVRRLPLPSFTRCAFRLFPFRSPLLWESLLIYFPLGTEMFHFPRLSSSSYVFTAGYADSRQRGFPHSDTHGSKVTCDLPVIFARCGVLHRLYLARHPPYTLSARYLH